MNDIHDKLFLLLTSNTDPVGIQRLIKSGLDTQDANFKEKLLITIFANYRLDQGKRKGLRLTSRGYLIFKSLLKHWTITFPDNFTVTSVHLLHLDTRMKMPYYFNAKAITVFDEKEATFIKLAAGDLSVWCRSNKPPK